MKDGGRCWREGRFMRKLALALAFQDEGQEGDRTAWAKARRQDSERESKWQRVRDSSEKAVGVSR